MIRITGFDHIVLRVADVERCLDFYHGVLGLPVERLEAFRAGKAPFPSLRVTPETILDVVRAREPVSQSASNLDHFCLVVADVAAAQAALEAAGVAIEDGPAARFGARGTATSIYIRDSDGNRLELRSYPG
jgi:catechol 2,3-dioxygenase-like lactoylglutathione lyase family enzyme